MFVYLLFLLLPTIPSCTYATFRLRQFKCDPITISNPDWAGYHQRLLGSNLLSARGKPCQRPGCHNLQSPEPESHGPQAQCCSSTLPHLLILPHRLHTSSRIVPVREIITAERMTSTGFVHRNAKPALENGDRATHLTGIENSQRRPSGAFFWIWVHADLDGISCSFPIRTLLTNLLINWYRTKAIDPETYHHDDPLDAASQCLISYSLPDPHRLWFLSLHHGRPMCE